MYRIDAGQGSGQYVHKAGPHRIGQLPGVRQVQPDLAVRQLLLGGVVALGRFGRAITDSVETRCSGAIGDQTGGEGPALVALAADLVLEIKLALHPLLDAHRGRPLLVLGRVLVQTRMHAIAEVGVVQHVRRDDPVDLVLIVGAQPYRQQTQGRTAVRIGGYLRYRDERGGRGIQPARKPARLRRLSWRRRRQRRVRRDGCDLLGCVRPGQLRDGRRTRQQHRQHGSRKSAHGRGYGARPAPAPI